jgi:hypothetical protein
LGSPPLIAGSVRRRVPCFLLAQKGHGIGIPEGRWAADIPLPKRATSCAWLRIEPHGAMRPAHRALRFGHRGHLTTTYRACQASSRFFLRALFAICWPSTFSYCVPATCCHHHRGSMKSATTCNQPAHAQIWYGGLERSHSGIAHFPALASARLLGVQLRLTPWRTPWSPCLPSKTWRSALT